MSEHYLLTRETPILPRLPLTIFPASSSLPPSGNSPKLMQRGPTTAIIVSDIL